jgi:hypothetical protein
MADKVDDDKKLAASLLAVAVQKKKNAPPFPAVLLVILWALLTAAIVLGSFALASELIDHYRVTPVTALSMPDDKYDIRKDDRSIFFPFW